MIQVYRIPFMMLAFLCLLTGIWTGLLRIGWEGLPVTAASSHHGLIMVGGFLGTLISLEKIIPLKKKILFAIPLISAVSTLLFLLSYNSFGLIGQLVASIGLVSVYAFYARKEWTMVIGIMMAGALCWVAGNVMLMTTKFYPMAFPWWLGFTLLTITAERLELMKFLPVKQNQKLILLICLFVFLIGSFFSFHGWGNKVSGCALIVIAIWLMRFDLIGITIRKTELQRFVAIALLAGYSALLLCGIFFIALDHHWLAYDMLVHSYFIGFVFSMILAHGPIILPGVLGISIKPYHTGMYVWLSLLHGSWVIRIVADLSMQMNWRMISGFLTGVAIIGYFIFLAVLVIKNRNEKV